MERKKEEGLRDGRESERMCAAREYLESYRHGCRMLRADRYAREYFDDGFDRDDTEQHADELDISLVRARLCAIRGFISSLTCGESGRTLLYYHYIRGIPVAAVAEMMGISRASAFRLRRRALLAAAEALEKWRA